jgi:Family of unknown function (DUF6069)
LKPASTTIDRMFALAQIDLAPTHPQPSTLRVAVATAAAIAGSLIADAIVVAAGAALFVSTKGYTHFRFPDYAKLTIIGVIIAGVAWPIVTRISAAPRWLFLRLAFFVSAVLFLPDVWLLMKHQPADAVGVLVVMHVAIAVVTYNLLVRIAPPLTQAAARGR